MLNRKMRTCCVCHEEYNFCPVCTPEDRAKPTWYFAYCSENCKNLYKATSDYEDGKISANEAILQLNNLDLSKVETFGESYKNAIYKIKDKIAELEKTKAVKKNKKEVIEAESFDENTVAYCEKPRKRGKKVDNVDNVE